MSDQSASRTLLSRGADFANRLWQGTAIVLVGVAIVITLPVMLPIMAVAQKRHQQRMLEIAMATRCERCGSILGAEALDRANTAWAEHVAALRRDFPTIRFRLKRDVWAICATCGGKYGFDCKCSRFGVLAG